MLSGNLDPASSKSNLTPCSLPNLHNLTASNTNKQTVGIIMRVSRHSLLLHLYTSCSVNDLWRTDYMGENVLGRASNVGDAVLGYLSISVYCSLCLPNNANSFLYIAASLVQRQEQLVSRPWHRCYHRTPPWKVSSMYPSLS